MNATAAFLDRLFRNLPPQGRSFAFKSWRHGSRPTGEGVGILPVPGVNVDSVAGRILDVAAYRSNIDFVVESRTVADPRYTPPKGVHFYQRIKIPVLGEVQMELALEDFGERDGWRVIAWSTLDAETNRLDPKRGARFEYNEGAWLLRGDAVGYALSSCPRKSDVGRLKFAAMTKGADASAPKMVKANIEGMLAWARRAG